MDLEQFSNVKATTVKCQKDVRESTESEPVTAFSLICNHSSLIKEETAWPIGSGLWPLADVVLGSPESNFSVTLVNCQLVCLPPVGILNLVMLIGIFIYYCFFTLVLKSPHGK